MARSSLAGAVVFLATRFLLLLALASAARIAFVLALRFYMRRRNVPLRRRILSDLGVLAAGTRQPRLVGLFHPYCNAGGGGERVLWAAVACLQREEPDVICLIYTGDTDATKAEMVEKAQARFGIALDRDRMHLVYLQSRHLVEDSTWTRFTLLGQSLGSIVLGHEALFQILPDIFIDTMGYAFTFPLVKLYADIPVGAYVHYPNISTDMLQRVKNRTSGHTNTSAVARSGLLSQAKLVYYVIFAWLYAWCLRRADYIMVNSSWTQAHVDHLLHDGQKGHAPAQPSILALKRKRAHIVYPPCDTKSLAVLPLENREELILSVAQFRPEKEHATQLRAFKAYLDRPDASPRIKLVLAGSVRNAGDSARVDSLRSLATDTLGIPSSRIEFIINPPFRDLVALFSRASVGLSTMVDEHFGINVVEFMCAGLVPLVHASGGPLLDIVTEEDGQPTGYHAKAPEDYADKLATILALSKDEQLKLRERARRKAIAQFSEANFDEGWMQAWSALKRLTIRK